MGYKVASLIVQWVRNDTLLAVNEGVQVNLATSYSSTKYTISACAINGGGGRGIVISDNSTYPMTSSSFYTLDTAYGPSYASGGRFFITIGT